MQDQYSDLDARIEAFRQSDAQRDQLLGLLVQRLRNLEASHKELSHDYENERMFRRHWQDKHDVAEKELISTRYAAENNCFVQVLIDGDASYFHEEAVKDGVNGGARVAAELYSEIRKYIDTLYPGSDLAILLHMYANLGGLSGMLTYSKIINSPSELYVFVRGFNNSQDMFNLVDVGAGKEQADHKLRETFRLFLANKQCKHIIFAGCHDNGYLNILRPLSHDPEKQQRVTLLETLPSQPGFKDLSFNMIKFPKIFKTEQPKLFSAPPPVQTQPIRSPSPKPASPAGSRNSSTTWSAKAAPTADTAAAAAGAAEVINVALKKKPKSPKYILQNVDDWRLDEKIPPVPGRDIESLKEKRSTHGNLCNELYLGGKCTKPDRCSYVHDIKLNAGELLALKMMARTLTCPERSYCEEFGCYNGHSCPMEVKGKKCAKGEDCKFSEFHGMDLRPAFKVWDDGRREKL